MDLDATAGPAAMVARLEAATNQHDLEGLIACFAPNYRNETPVHPARGFTGHEQVRRNWTQIFEAVPDIQAEVTRHAVDGPVVWSEWEMRGTRLDGGRHLMRGVVVFEVDDGKATFARFYLEPVDDGPDNADEAVRRALSPRDRS